MKICNKENCNNNVFSNGYCLWHQRERTDDKFKNLTMNKKMKKPTGEREIFDSIWSKRKHVSFLSGINLDYVVNTAFYPNCFAHVLCKKNYPEYRLSEDNIILLHPYEHLLLDQGTEQNREQYAKDHKCNWNVVFDLKKVLTEKYKEQWQK